MDDWGRSKDSDGGAESITDMRPGQGEGKEGAVCFRFDRFDIDVAVMHTPCFVGKNDECNEDEIWDLGRGNSKRTVQVAATIHASRAASSKRMDYFLSLTPHRLTSTFQFHPPWLNIAPRKKDSTVSETFRRHDQGKQERAQAMQDDQPNSR
ncbi:uncharacterized protein BKA55DRAFT_543150 [Fusarium redolens]|uniref:Uncharacterized protein n=1 Tax=Fusarium redolens TaxID=48865 RepID=A0A9P9JUM8_FUSRE|nr:uncharacterized protein BKA55DRAFT_543150 [Fusarium redolens]KAH7237628.1 hypothetical protein BKA55DRAFT_543150 [Fusarium redolens]